MYVHILIGVGGSTATVVLFAMFCVIPWHSDPRFSILEPSYLIPLVGMLLGNTLSGVSLGLTTVLEELAAGEILCKCSLFEINLLLARIFM